MDKKKMTIFIVRRTGNATVTSNNFDILRDASIETGCNVEDYATLRTAIKKGKMNDVFIVTTALDAVILSAFRKKNLVYWSQGIAPEESYLYHKSKARFNVLSYLEKKAIKKVSANLFVSDAMRKHYESKYNLKINNYYIFPCFNTNICKEAFYEDGKYEKNYFAYAGALSLWQCFDETLQIYKYYEDLNLPNTKLIVLTKNNKYAESKIKEVGIKNYEIGYTSKEELPKILSKVKFGFVIRKYHPINVVSTPTKISTYLSCGLIPIFGECVQSFSELPVKYCVPWNDSPECRAKVIEFMTQKIDADAVFQEYNNVFSSHYSYNYHVKNISIILKDIIGYENN